MTTCINSQTGIRYDLEGNSSAIPEPSYISSPAGYRNTIHISCSIFVLGVRHSQRPKRVAWMIGRGRLPPKFLIQPFDVGRHRPAIGTALRRKVEIEHKASFLGGGWFWSRSR